MVAGARRKGVGMRVDRDEEGIPEDRRAIEDASSQELKKCPGFWHSDTRRIVPFGRSG